MVRYQSYQWLHFESNLWWRSLGICRRRKNVLQTFHSPKRVGDSWTSVRRCAWNLSRWSYCANSWVPHARSSATRRQTETINKYIRTSCRNCWWLVEVSEITPEVAVAIKRVWSSDAIQQLWQQRSSLQLIDTVAHFIERVDEIATFGYLPSSNDIIFARIRTTGIREERLRIDNQVPILLHTVLLHV